MLSFLVQKATVNFKMEHIESCIYSENGKESHLKIAGLQKQTSFFFIILYIREKGHHYIYSNYFSLEPDEKKQNSQILSSLLFIYLLPTTTSIFSWL